MVSVFFYGKRLNKMFVVFIWFLFMILGIWFVGGRENNLVLLFVVYSIILRCGVC